jgi:DNA-binding winged helix-turn-helix (wHTH) protein
MGETKHDGLAIPGRVVLAHEPPFTIGKLRVQPASRQVEAQGRHETVEPRVMQVLVALARANGSIVTRDELLERCWDARIVTDDAINRVLSRIRQIGSGIGAGSFKIETVTKVGYRLIEQALEGLPVGSGSKKSRKHSATVDRRAVVAGVATAAATAVVGALLWERPWRHHPVTEAKELFRRGDMAQRAGTPDQSRQSVSYFERAVQIDPQYADAWGALALAYTHNLEGFGEAELASLPARIRSAAARALTMDSENADAQLALICIDPFYRNWARIEGQLRRLCERFPSHWLAHGRLAMLLYQVGRLDEGIKLHRKVISIDPMIPVPYAAIAQALSARGRVQEAETVLREAQDRWPAHPLIWTAKYACLLFSGRADAAAAFIKDPDALPSGFGHSEVEPRLMLARAVASGQGADVTRSVELFTRIAATDPTNIPVAAAIFSLLGRVDLTFASLERYYFSRGTFRAPDLVGPYVRHYTDSLFSAPMAAARSDRRFTGLLRQTALEAYWRQTHTVPDYKADSVITAFGMDRRIDRVPQSLAGT